MEWTPDMIRLFRRHLRLTAKQFADAMGLSRQQTVYEWEGGRATPAGTAQKLMDCLADGAGFTEGVARKMPPRKARNQ